MSLNGSRGSCLADVKPMSDWAVLRLNKFSIRCQHNNFIVAPSLNTVECGICGKELNPIWVLEQLCNKESRANRRVQQLQQMADAAIKMNRCKCEHCNQMTRIKKR